jgi:hypothetical protein
MVQNSVNCAVKCAIEYFITYFFFNLQKLSEMVTHVISFQLTTLSC